MSLSGGATVASDSAVVEPIEYFRKDYAPSGDYLLIHFLTHSLIYSLTHLDYVIEKIYLNFELTGAKTVVTATSNVLKNAQVKGSLKRDLVLDGEELDLVSVAINKKIIGTFLFCSLTSSLTSSLTYVGNDMYKYSNAKLIISAAALPDEPFELTTIVNIKPDKNLALSGLYQSGSNLLCTQCEAMGFRRIAFHLDRPDILTIYTVRLEGDKALYPILLSNGNMVAAGDLGDNKHYTVWEDPFPKPSYLFALVAGDLGSIHDEYTTASGRRVKLGIFSDKENAGKLSHAMYSIKESMRWDEEVFGLECDLDVYNIVATNDFNMGAMENKGLNIFNSAYVLADSATATDNDYERILGVIGHEYFHNWTGNRVTVRDWFQLTLKEGLTVFRDQWFSSDKTSHAVKRIEDVRILRGRQFAEDQGPMAHPIRPESYISMDNFYTGTVYIKGAEVVRLYRTLLGEEGFKKGMKLYFQRHDGGAVTCDDFRLAMQDANNFDLTQFERWYSQAGTPIVDVVDEVYDASKQTYSITFAQHIPSTPGQDTTEKLPLLIPVVIGLLNSVNGEEMVPSTVLQFKEAQQTFTFSNIPVQPIPSLFRDFSAPIRLNYKSYNDDTLAFLMTHDTDSFNRWDAGNKLSTNLILSLTKLGSVDAIKNTPLNSNYINAFRSILTSCSSDSVSDMSLVAYALQLPDEITLSQEMDVIDVDKLHAARDHVKHQLIKHLHSEFLALYQAATASKNEYVFSPAEVGRRRLRNTCLDYLTSSDDSSVIDMGIKLAKEQFDSANCMTDKISALGCLISFESKETVEATTKFYNDANGDALVLNKWFAIQAMADNPDILNKVKQLKSHPDFVVTNPNRARSLISTFAGNMPHFHNKNGSGYQFIADCIIEIDRLNPQVAARLASSFSQWKRYDEQRQEQMKAELVRIKNTVNLSKDTFEVVTRCLK